MYEILFPVCPIGFSDRETPDEISLQIHDLDHRNVVSLVGVHFVKFDPCIVMPYMENGSLLAHLKKESHNLIVTEKDIVNRLASMLLCWGT